MKILPKIQIQNLQMNTDIDSCLSRVLNVSQNNNISIETRRAPLFRYLDHQLSSLLDHLTPTVFDRVIKGLFSFLIRVIKKKFNEKFTPKKKEFGGDFISHFIEIRQRQLENSTSRNYSKYCRSI
jgi:hypothetical protein